MGWWVWGGVTKKNQALKGGGHPKNNKGKGGGHVKYFGSTLRWDMFYYILKF